MNNPRHKWSEPTRIPHGIALPRKTERECLRCGLVKVTWHELDERGWEACRTEFWHGLDQIEGDGTPACEVMRVLEGATV